MTNKEFHKISDLHKEMQILKTTLNCIDCQKDVAITYKGFYGHEHEYHASKEIKNKIIEMLEKEFEMLKKEFEKYKIDWGE